MLYQAWFIVQSSTYSILLSEGIKNNNKIKITAAIQEYKNQYIKLHVVKINYIKIS